MQLDYNPAEVPADERGEFSLLPEANYTFFVNGSEEKAGKREGAVRLVFTVTVTGPTNKGQKLWPEFNVRNPSEQSQKIGRQELNRFAEACGVPTATLRESGQMHNKVFAGRVSIKTGADGKERNEIKNFAPVSGTRPQSAAPRAAFTPPAQASLPVDGAPAPAAPAGQAAPPPWMKAA